MIAENNKMYNTVCESRTAFLLSIEYTVMRAIPRKELSNYRQWLNPCQMTMKAFFL